MNLVHASRAHLVRTTDAAHRVSLSLGGSVRRGLFEVEPFLSGEIEGVFARPKLSRDT